MSKAKYTKIGIIRNSKDPEQAKKRGPFISLGEATNSNPKYVRHVEVRVTDGEGNQLAYVKDGIITVQDPRNNPNRTEEQKAAIPAWLLKELFIVEKD